MPTDYVLGGIIGYLVGWVTALFAISAAGWMGGVADRAERACADRARARARRLDVTPLAERRRVEVPR